MTERRTPGRVAFALLILLTIGMWGTTLLPGVAGAMATFDPPHSDSGLDTDSDGLFDYLVVDANINVSEAGTFLVDANLYDPTFTLFLFTSNLTTLDVGLQTVPLWFPGPSINGSGVAGPYTVDLWLTEYVNFTFLDFDTHTTAAYSHLDFEEPPLVLSPPHSDSGLDTDGDGLFDFLVVNVSVNVSGAGAYFIQGTLRDPTFALFTFTGNFTDLSAGLQTVPLWFFGPDINASGVDGPYIADLTVFNATTFTFIAAGNHTTAAYSHLDFEGPPAAFAPPHSDFGLDTDDDGLFDYLVVNVTVNVGDPGTYLILGSTFLGPGVNLSTFNLTTLDTGLQTVPLWFYGPSLSGSGTDGPYFVNLALMNLTTFMFLDSDSYLTAPYSTPEFEGPEVLLSAPAAVAPAIDGSLSAGEWGDASLVDLSSIPGNQVPGLLYVKNDADLLYVAYDATGDTTEDLGDGASVAFDTGNDGIATDGGEDEFTQGGFVGQGHYVYDASIGFWNAEDSPYNPGLPDHQGLASAAGFGPSESSPTPHRTYEFAIPLALLGTGEGGTLGFFGGSQPLPGLLDAGVALGFSLWPGFAAAPLPLWAYGDLILADVTAPVLSIDLPTTGAFLATGDVAVQWAATDAGSGLDRFEVVLDGGAPVVLPSTTTSRTFTGLADGFHTVTVTAFDNAGNSQAATTDFTVDTVQPSLSIDAPSEGSFLAVSNVRLTWTASDAVSGIERFEATLDGGTPVVLPSTAEGHTFPGVSDGSHTVNVTAVDRAGNTRTVLLALTVDTGPPAVSVSSPGSDVILTSSEVEVRWVAVDATAGIDRFEVSLDGGAAVTLQATATNHVFSGVGDGPHTISVTAVDRAGNSVVATVDVTVDTNVFSPTGPFGITLLVAIPAVIAAVAVAVAMFLWLRRRAGRPPP